MIDNDRAWFSPVLNRIAEVAGVRAALVIGREKGCQKIYIPKIADNQHWLRRMVGDDAAEKLCAEFGGSWLEIPAALSGQTRQRRRAIAEMNAKGYSLNEISRAAGVTRGTVKNHRRRLKGSGGDGGQGSLF